MNYSVKVNYMEPCTCGYDREEVTTERVWRIITWKCPKCGKTLAQTMLSDSPVTGLYVRRHLLQEANTNLRKEKGLEPKRTIVTFYDEQSCRIPWKEIEDRNRKWEKSVGMVQRKPF